MQYRRVHTIHHRLACTISVKTGWIFIVHLMDFETMLLQVTNRCGKKLKKKLKRVEVKKRAGSLLDTKSHRRQKENTCIYFDSFDLVTGLQRAKVHYQHHYTMVMNYKFSI